MIFFHLDSVKITTPYYILLGLIEHYFFSFKEKLYTNSHLTCIDSFEFSYLNFARRKTFHFWWQYPMINPNQIMIMHSLVYNEDFDINITYCSVLLVPLTSGQKKSMMKRILILCFAVIEQINKFNMVW